MKKPNSYFKFLSFERKDVLENGVIRFAPIGEFNDPFELEPVITPISREYLEYFSKLTDQERESLNFTEEDYSYSINRVELMGKYKELYEKKMKEFGVLCLTSNHHINPLLSVCIPTKDDPRTNILMWSHYAESHKGFVIEFEHNFIPEAIPRQVIYSNERDCLTFEDIEHNDFHEVFYKKSLEWSYEQEYRAVLPLSKASKIHDQKYHLFEFDKNCVRSITFGCAMSQENKDVIIDIIKNDDQFKNVEFNHALLNNDDFCLQFYGTYDGWTNNPATTGVHIPTQKLITSEKTQVSK